MNRPLKTSQRIVEETEPEERDDAVIGRAMRSSLVALFMLAVIGGVAFFLLTRPKRLPPIKETKLAPVQIREATTLEIPVVKFVDVTTEVGIEFKHNNGATGRKLLPETMGGGVAVLDFDNDGDQDVLFVNSNDWPEDQDAGKPSITKSPSSKSPSTMVLYRNDEGTFTDVSAGSGLDVSMYGMGAAVGDFDNDGLVDVFITAVGSNALFRNLGDGKFEDVTATAGVAGDAARWSSSAGWFDYDNDNDLDLFVANYVEWTRAYDESQNFQLVGGGRAYGRPQNFEGTFPYLYRNEGSGKFADVSREAGVQIRNPLTSVPLAKSLGVTFCDLDLDGYVDILLANDTVQNLLLRNTGQGKFSEIGVLSGIAFDSSGNARGAMGIDVAPFRGSSAMAIAIGNFANEMTALYVSRRGSLQFFDEAVSTGLGPSTRGELTFGLFYFDYDLDGRLDLFCSNGHLEEEINRVQPSQHYEQPPQLFWNAGAEQGTEFVRVDSAHCGEQLQKPMVGRGATYLDFDSDGDVDILVTAAGRAPRLLRNDNDLSRHYLRLKLVGDGQRCNRDAIGSWVEVRIGEQIMRAQVMPTRSYLSQVELPLTFGLGERDKVDEVIVHWPDGEIQSLQTLAVDQMHVIER